MKKQRKSDFGDVPTVPDGRYRQAYQIWRYRGSDVWELVRGDEVVGSVFRRGGAWCASVAGGTPRVGFLTAANANEWVEEQCD